MSRNTWSILVNAARYSDHSKDKVRILVIVCPLEEESQVDAEGPFLLAFLATSDFEIESNCEGTLRDAY